MAYNPKLSVIIPVYNQQRYITECLDSIYNQKGLDFEVIAVDDGSTDGTLKILREYEKAHPHMTVLTQENKSAGAARNYGLSVAVGELVLFMDSDDFLEDGAFEVIDRITQTETADIYLYNFKTFDDKTEEVAFKPPFANLDKILSTASGKYKYTKTNFESKKEFFVWSFVAPWNKVFNRRFVVDNDLKFDEIFSTNDRTFHFSTIVKSKDIVILDAPLINYRINNTDSLTGTYNESKFNNRKLAYNSSLRFIDKSDTLLSESFFKATVLDFVSFFQKTDSLNKYGVFLDTVKFFDSIDVLDIPCAHNNKDKFGFLYNLFVDSKYLLEKDVDSIVPVVFATNDKYLPYLSVSLQSLIENSSEERFYDVYIFHTSLSELNQIKICNMSTNNVHVRTVDMNVMVNDLPLYERSHFSVEMYYRILISEILWQYNKVLYLDCDIAIQADVAELFDTDLNGNILAVVRNLLDVDMYKYVTNVLKMEEELYFNSGILVIDTNLFKENDTKNKCFEILGEYKNLVCPDQDILNISCKNKCLYLDEIWNFQSGNHSYTTKFKYEKLSDIKIIHYTTGQKPWNTKDLPLSEIFWDYARKTPYYEDIVFNYINSTLKLDTLVLNQNGSGVAPTHRNVINNKNQRHYKIINPFPKKPKSWITWPLRFIKEFFVIWKESGFKNALKYVPEKIKYVVNRLLGRVDKDNNLIMQ